MDEESYQLTLKSLTEVVMTVVNSFANETIDLSDPDVGQLLLRFVGDARRLCQTIPPRLDAQLKLLDLPCVEAVLASLVVEARGWGLSNHELPDDLSEEYMNGWPLHQRDGAESILIAIRHVMWSQDVNIDKRPVCVELHAILDEFDRHVAHTMYKWQLDALLGERAVIPVRMWPHPRFGSRDGRDRRAVAGSGGKS